MTKDKALRLALEALEVANSLVDSYYLPKEKAWMPEIEEAITAIKAALEAKDEPVAWMRTSGTGSPVVTEALLVEMPEMRWNFQQPLYTTSPQRKPLTIEQPKVRTGDCLLVGVCASEGHKIQPRRTWVGLTIDEREQIQQECFGKVPHHVAFAHAIEAKLKEKNMK